jgi:hypothetical protein
MVHSSTLYLPPPRFLKVAQGALHDSRRQEMNLEIKALCNGVWEKSRQCLTVDGHVHPIFFIVHDRGMEMVLGDFKDDTEKERLKHTVRVVAKQLSAIAVIHVTEGWALRPSEADRDKEDVLERTLKGKRISGHPKRYETLILTCMLAGGETFCRSATIIRARDGTVTLIDEESESEYDKVEWYMIEPWGRQKKNGAKK